MHHRSMRFLACSVGCITCCTGISSAQNALGAGDALDNDLQREGFIGSVSRIGVYDSSGYGNVLDAGLSIGPEGVRDLRNFRGFTPDYQVGNLLVTGSLAGGKNFQGDVGYTAPGDFQGYVGADDIYAELRGSGLSQIQFVNSALANDRYANALGMGLYEFRRDYTPAPQIYTVSQASRINQDRIRLDRTNAYTSSSDLYETAVNPSSLGLFKETLESGEQGDLYLSLEASPMQGLYVREMEIGVPYSGLSLYDRAALLTEMRNGLMNEVELGRPYQTQLSRTPPEQMFQMRVDSLAASTQPFDNKIEGNILKDDPVELDAYERVVRELLLSQRAGEDIDIDIDDEEVLDRVRDQLDEIRSMTAGQDVTRPYIDEVEDEADSLFDIDRQEQPDPTSGAEVESPGLSNRVETEEEKEERLRQERQLRIEQAAELIRNGGRIESFSEGQMGRIAQLMESGEKLLRSGQFFEAESRFDQILRINPGNPLALFGRGNAQLGAGLYLSSALTLRKLYTAYPELIGVSLSTELLPSETRLRFIMKKLRERILRGKDLPSYGLCLAYTGWLLGEQTTISEGLSYLSTDPNDATLAELLRNVWIMPETRP